MPMLWAHAPDGPRGCTMSLLTLLIPLRPPIALGLPSTIRAFWLTRPLDLRLCRLSKPSAHTHPQSGPPLPSIGADPHSPLPTPTTPTTPSLPWPRPHSTRRAARTAEAPCRCPTPPPTTLALCVSYVPRPSTTKSPTGQEHGAPTPVCSAASSSCSTRGASSTPTAPGPRTTSATLSAPSTS
jgi:hypothetical protein